MESTGPWHRTRRPAPPASACGGTSSSRPGSGEPPAIRSPIPALAAEQAGVAGADDHAPSFGGNARGSNAAGIHRVLGGLESEIDAALAEVGRAAVIVVRNHGLLHLAGDARAEPLHRDVPDGRNGNPARPSRRPRIAPRSIPCDGHRSDAGHYDPSRISVSARHSAFVSLLPSAGLPRIARATFWPSRPRASGERHAGCGASARLARHPIDAAQPGSGCSRFSVGGSRR